MLSLFRSSVGIILCCTVVFVVGCSNQQDDESLQLPDFLTEADEAPAAERVPTAGRSTAVTLELKLRPGDRFPLSKVVEQELHQPSLTGEPIIHRTRLEMRMVITVEQVQQGRTRLGVRYDRIRFSSNLAGEVTEFDSAMASTAVPPAAAPYQRMVGRGFSFWLGPDNQIVETVGFEEFCNQCIATRQELLSIEAFVGEKGVADFVDNSIGLLSYGMARSPGDTWHKPRHISRPVPLQMNTEYTLRELNDSVAVIDVYGEYLPSTTFSDSTSPTGVRVVVQSGSARGTCTVFRETGLPRESNVVEQIQMIVQQSGAIEFPQQLVRRTTIEAFPDVRGTEGPTVWGTSPVFDQRVSGGAPEHGAAIR